MKSTLTIITLLSISSFLIGCSESIDSTGQDGDDTCQQSDISEDENGVRSITINAMDYENWVKLHLDEGVTDGDQWDIAIRRYAIRINGGESGVGLGLGQWLEGDLFSADTDTPEVDWTADGVTPDTTIFGDWFDYDGMTHQLSPKDRTYFVKSHDAARYYMFAIEDYYTSPPARDSGCMQLLWKLVAAPENPPVSEAGTGTLPIGEGSPNMMNETEEEIAAEDDPAAGCYSGPPMHMCDCELSLTECEASEGSWTELCACDEAP